MKRIKMRMGLLAAGIAAAVATSPASAVTFTIGAANTGPVDVTSQYSSYTLYNFDNLSSPFVGGAVKTTSAPPLYAAPAGDSSPYFAVGPSTSSPATFAITGINQVSFYWGSIDSYNRITFLGIPGASFDGTVFDGTDATRNSREITFNFNATEAAQLTGIQLASDTNAFEIDNLVVGNAVPEPATYGIMSLGLGMVGAVLRRRRKEGTAGNLRLA